MISSRSATIAYDAATNRVASATVNGVARTYAYDPRGNTTSNGATGFTYDFANQPTALTGTGAAAFTYDGNLKRVKEVRGGKTIYTIYSRLTGGLVYRDEMTDAKTTDYANAGGAAVRLTETGGGAAVPTYVHFDHLGSAVAASSASGGIIWRERYAPFGKATRTLGAAPANDNNTGFTGHLEDDASGLVYMQARYYDPLVPRFLSTDPIGYQDQLNLYAYVANDPVNAWDPNGEERRGFSVTVKLAIGKFGFRGTLDASYDDETNEIGASVTAGYRAGAAVGAKVELYEEPSSEQGNRAEGEVEAVAEGSAEIAKVGVSGEASVGVSLSTDKGLQPTADASGGVSKGAAEADSSGRKSVSLGGSVGAAVGIDVTLSGNVSLGEQGSDANANSQGCGSDKPC